MNIYEIQADKLITLLDDNIKEFWFIKKDKLEVCKDCEFRYMCVDNRIPMKKGEFEWFFEDECGYNPYISKWVGDKGYCKVSEMKNKKF